jgi:hypothetical protein
MVRVQMTTTVKGRSEEKRSIKMNSSHLPPPALDVVVVAGVNTRAMLLHGANPGNCKVRFRYEVGMENCHGPAGGVSDGVERSMKRKIQCLQQNRMA